MAHTHTHTIVIENGNGNRWDSCTAPRLTRLSLIQVKHQRAPASHSLPLSPRLLIKIYDFSHAHMSVCVWGMRVRVCVWCDIVRLGVMKKLYNFCQIVKSGTPLK